MEIETVSRDLIQQSAIGSSTTVLRERLRPAYVLSGVVAGLAATVSVIALLFPTVYPARGWRPTFLANDLVTLLTAVPILVLSLVYSTRGSARARMIWLGALYYMLYNYAFYVFGLPVTKLYLAVIASFTLSGFALALGMSHLDVEAIGRQFRSNAPAKWIAAYLIFVAVMIGNLWISQWVKFVITGKVPEVNGDASAYKVIAAVDLSFMVPVALGAGCLLWKRRAWGYVLAVMFCLMGGLYNAVMATACVFGWIAAPGSPLVSGWFISCIVAVGTTGLCLWGLLRSVRRSNETYA